MVTDISRHVNLDPYAVLEARLISTFARCHTFSPKGGVTVAHIYPKVASWTEGSLAQENGCHNTDIYLCPVSARSQMLHTAPADCFTSYHQKQTSPNCTRSEFRSVKLRAHNRYINSSSSLKIVNIWCIQRITMCPQGYHHNGSMTTPATGHRDTGSTAVDA